MKTKSLQNYAQSIDAFNHKIGQMVSWLSLALVLLMFTIVVLRYLFDLNWIWLQELAQYFHAFLFMLGAAYTLKEDAHVRVDIFYRNYNKRTRAKVELFGTIFLLAPFCIFMFINVGPYVFDSWQELEGPLDTGGLGFVYVLKSAMLIMPILILLQGVAIGIKAILVLISKDDDGLEDVSAGGPD